MADYAFQGTYGSSKMGNSGGSPTNAPNASRRLSPTENGYTQQAGAYQPGTTFAQLQQQGYARPAMPGLAVNPMAPNMMSPNMDPSRLNRPNAMIQPPAQQGGGGSPFAGGLTTALQQLLSNPSRFNQDTAKSTFDMLNNRLGDQYKVAQSDIQGEMARRGLLSSTVYGGKLGDLASNQARAQSDLATNIANAQATGYTSDLMQAIQGAMGYEQQQFGQQLGTAQFNQNQDNQFYEQLMAMLGMT